MSDKQWDLNVFFKEDWSESEGTTWSNVYYINPAIYTYNDKQYTEHVWETTPAETKAIAEAYPESEYGSDFCVFADEFINDVLAPRLHALIRSLPELP